MDTIQSGNKAINLEKQLKIAQAANRIARLLSKAEGLETAIENLMSEFIELVHADEGSIQLLRPFSTTTRCTLIRKEDKSNRLLDRWLDDFLTGCVMKEKQALIYDNLSELIGLKGVAKRYREIQSVLAVPIATTKETIGAVNLISTKTDNRFSAADQDSVLELANQIGDFIENIELREKLFNDNIRLQRNLEERYSVHGIIGNSPKFKEVYDLLERVIPTDARVVILGESGTGKELIAKCIHYAGPRKDRSFVAVDCGALPPNLLESELFGYVRGAFTGAVKDRRGLIEEAHTGTLFLDEFTNMSLETQAKLLRVVQEGEVRPIGSNQVKKVDVRIIVAASSDLTERISDGKIRSDLYYRLNVVSVPIPPLRDRVEDIPQLATQFLRQFAKKHGKTVKKISSNAMQIFEQYSWPGNIRELENVIERAVVMMHFEENVLLPKHLPIEVISTEIQQPSSEIPVQGDLTSIVANYEREVIQAALNEHDWNQSAAAQALNISEAVIRYKIKRLNLNRPK
jgi:transcriptional regulator with GAF, ATPase, and Fis domain